ncbi:alcohol dehydrogenase catalytic domain-containing protein [Pediococcus pentosaceus]|uniref:Alcohol dehydrogenase catalytic domain-containing protein n=1 Tax=Pediococcus pentosaceus TaxID=1255 RepID=A0AB73HG44_PEDPE|nr:alcohol dehydrogenase catalytic domain-containing protein [Pediococcus pentosaceus]MBF7102133.1 alcohol dehydrogenase catalytic domain-containing protein [Pediococcus pentosaceus]MBF7114291.1 alcohol dehydrogenase catalytic domain-containing protein [Pediococcus pentosaceus]MBF7129013.1 alcohol dehydrogenase catalytic domain-containing protein [Pediococcus pentosaceus]MBF7131859.1 alcohol dehydrogenase catalytic domain-containing protein [Pediococcus pentosaceus]MCM6792034.1 alcohol dehydro
MKAAVFIEPGKVEIKEVPKPQIDGDNQAIIRIVRASVCGSDLWWYRGISERQTDTFIGHEAIGVVEETSADVDNIQVGDFVVVPFTHGCGHCVACLNGFEGDCLNRKSGDNGGYQAEYMKYEPANSGLVKIPGKPEDYTDAQLASFQTLSDVMATGYHAAQNAEVKPGSTVAVIGDGAVGLCGVIGAKLLGASKIILLSHHEDRAELGKAFGATDIVDTRGDEAIQDVLKLTKENAGADAILECVGATSAIEQAGQIARPGAVIGRVGVPQSEPKSNQLFWKNVGLRGGIASVTKPDKEVLLQAVLDGEINPGQVFTKSFDLDHIEDAYEAMSNRQVIKALLVISDK